MAYLYRETVGICRTLYRYAVPGELGANRVRIRIRYGDSGFGDPFGRIWLLSVHYNLRLLSHYYDRANEDQSYRVWDNNPEDDNLEDGMVHMEELEAEIFRDDDEASAPPPHTGPVPPSSSSAGASANASASSQYQTIVPLQIQPPPSSHGRGCGTPESTRRPPFPRGSHKLDISRGCGKGPTNR